MEVALHADHVGDRAEVIGDESVRRCRSARNQVSELKAKADQTARSEDPHQALDTHRSIEINHYGEHCQSYPLKTLPVTWDLRGVAHILARRPARPGPRLRSVARNSELRSLMCRAWRSTSGLEPFKVYPRAISNSPLFLAPAGRPSARPRPGPAY